MNAAPVLRFLSVSLVVLLAACAHRPSEPSASAQLEARSGSEVSGTVIFTPLDDKIRIEAAVRGLEPGEHGFHIHEVGDCSAPDASSAKGHFNPGNQLHGHYVAYQRHAGDLPSLKADDRGEARYMVEVSSLSLTPGPTSVIGRSVVVHADPDDYQTQPAGNSGKRLACGVIHAR